MKRSLPLIAAFVAILSLTACGGGSGGSGSPQPAPAPVPPALVKTDISIGVGAEAVTGKTVRVHYTGWLYSTAAVGNKGAMFDSSSGRQPHLFTLGDNKVIAGFEQGVLGMKVGGRRTVIIPASLGYGSTGTPTIPPNTGLVFDLELVEVQ